MEHSEIVEVITKAKAGDHLAKNQVVKMIQDNGYMRAISHYLYLNRLLEPDDVRSEFWIGVILALPKVSTSIGDPLFYLAWQGANRIKNQLRKAIGKGTQVQCNTCGWVGRFYRVKGDYECRKCGNKDLRTWQKEINETSIFRTQLNPDTLEDGQMSIFETKLPTPPTQLEVDIKIDMEYFKTKLSARELNVFILITEEHINRHHEDNYLTTIANKLGISPQCVSAYLIKIRKKLRDLYERPQTTIQRVRSEDTSTTVRKSVT